MIVKHELPAILTAQDIADYLGISRRRVYELMQINEEVGGIKCLKIGTSKRIDRNDFLAWMEDRKISRY